MSAPKIINFAKATKRDALRELEKIAKKHSGCAPPEIPYALFKRAIDTGIGEIASPMRINQEVKNPTGTKIYRQTMCADGFNYQCYTSKPIDMSSNFIEPSEIITMDEWMKKRNL